MSLLRFLALTSLFSLALAGQPPSSDLLTGLSWRLAGPFRGGRSVAASGVPGDGRTFFFGSVGGGIWKTSDVGTVWTPIFDSQPVASIGALEVAPSNPQIIYAGTGESDIRSDLASGDGVYKSTDGGETWKNCGLKDTRQISRIVVDPANANVVYVAALGHAYAPNPERGVYRSRDGGETWEKVLFKKPVLGAADIAIASDAPRGAPMRPLRTRMRQAAAVCFAPTMAEPRGPQWPATAFRPTAKRQPDGAASAWRSLRERAASEYTLLSMRARMQPANPGFTAAMTAATIGS
jgi:hypothetical protein